MTTTTAPAHAPKLLPAPEAHAPMTFRNRGIKGGKILTGCSCGWRATTGITRMSTMWNAWLRHERNAVPGRDSYGTIKPVQGEGTFAGWTWDEYHAAMKDAGMSWDDPNRPDYYSA